MKKYRVKVNGKVYEVELESIEEVKGSINFKQTDTNTNNEKAKPKATEEVRIASPEGTKVKAFMQGKIIDVKVSEGQEVIEGQMLMILEAMKMENEIVAPVSGTVVKVVVNKNDNVENQETLMIIR
jgi:biotin carboxyl carrier protein